MRTPLRSLSLLAAVALPATLAACQDAQQVVSSAGGGGPAPVLRVEWQGGFVPVGAGFARLPRAHLLDDGRHFAEAPQIAVFPGPALGTAQVRDVGEDGVEALLDLARELDLDRSGVDYGQPPVADAPDTVVRISIDGQTYEHRAVALAEYEGDALPGLTPEQQQARARLADFVEAAVDPSTVLPPGSVTDEGLFDADRYRLVAVPDAAPDAEPVPADAASGSQLAEGEGLEADERPWPLTGIDLAAPAATECLPVEGDQAQALEQLLEGATQATTWTSGGRSYTVAVRPVLPGEPTCPVPAR